MGWLDAVKNFAQNVAIGQNPDAFLKRLQLSEQFKNDEQRRRLSEDENTRAQGEYGQKQTQWAEENKNAPVRAALLAAGLDEKQADALLAKTKAGNEPARFKGEQAANEARIASERASAGASSAAAAHARGEESRAQTMAPVQLQAAKAQAQLADTNAKVAAMTADSKIEDANDPAVNEKAMLQTLSQNYGAAVRAGDDNSLEQAKTLYTQMQGLYGDIQRKKAMRAAQRQSVNTVNNQK